MSGGHLALTENAGDPWRAETLCPVRPHPAPHRQLLSPYRHMHGGPSRPLKRCCWQKRRALAGWRWEGAGEAEGDRCAAGAPLAASGAVAASQGGSAPAPEVGVFVSVARAVVIHRGST